MRAWDGGSTSRYRLDRATGELQENKEEHRMAQTAQYDHIGVHIGAISTTIAW
jgi:hypothetical protein